MQLLTKKEKTRCIYNYKKKKKPFTARYNFERTEKMPPSTKPFMTDLSQVHDDEGEDVMRSTLQSNARNKVVAAQQQEQK